MAVNLFTSSVLILYLVLSILDCLAAAQHGSRVLKPLLMPALAVYFIMASSTRGIPAILIVLIIIGLILGCIGDVFLLPNGRGFVEGAVAFLAGHLFYITSAWMNVSLAGKGITALILIPVPFYIICGTLLSRKILPHVPKKLKLPVSLYIIVILAMSCSMCCRMILLFPESKGAIISFAGSVFFVMSDFILASAFFRKTPEKGIMETYLAAQFLLVQGFVV